MSDLKPAILAAGSLFMLAVLYLLIRHGIRMDTPPFSKDVLHYSEPERVKASHDISRFAGKKARKSRAPVQMPRTLRGHPRGCYKLAEMRVPFTRTSQQLWDTAKRIPYTKGKPPKGILVENNPPVPLCLLVPRHLCRTQRRFLRRCWLSCWTWSSEPSRW